MFNLYPLTWRLVTGLRQRPGIFCLGLGNAPVSKKGRLEQVKGIKKALHRGFCYHTATHLLWKKLTQAHELAIANGLGSHRVLRIYEGTSEIQRIVIARELLKGNLKS